MVKVPLRVATYNIHRSRGLDRRTDPSRIADVVASLEADIIALQEVIGPGPEGMGQAEEIAAKLGMTPVMAPVRLLRGRPFGNAIIGRFPVCGHHRHDLTWHGREARGVQRVDLQIGKGVLHVYNVHLGTALLERRAQAVHLARILDAPTEGEPCVMLGDFNEWLRGPATRVLTERLGSLDLRFLHLDHIYYRGEVEIVSAELKKTRKALIASDHLPLIADLKIGF
jgi:endonuclease/exonuclease/phosphatase family metal-dependent hydrolase